MTRASVSASLPLSGGDQLGGEWGGGEGLPPGLKGTFELASPPRDLPGGRSTLPYANNPYDDLRLGTQPKGTVQSQVRGLGFPGQPGGGCGRACMRACVCVCACVLGTAGWVEPGASHRVISKGLPVLASRESGSEIGQAGFLFGEKNKKSKKQKQNQIIKSRPPIVHIFCCDFSLRNLRQQR